MVASVYMGPLGTTQLVQGTIPNASAFVVQFSQNTGPQTFLGDSVEHVLIPSFPVNFTSPGNAALDISVGLATVVPSLTDNELAINFYFDGNPAGSMALVMPLGGGLRVVRGSVAFAGPIPLGVHTLELRVVSTIDVELGQAIGLFGAGCDAQIRVMFGS